MNAAFKKLKKRDKVRDRWYGGVGRVVRKLKTVVYIEFTGTNHSFIDGLHKWDAAHVRQFLEVI